MAARQRSSASACSRRCDTHAVMSAAASSTPSDANPQLLLVVLVVLLLAVLSANQELSQSSEGEKLFTTHGTSSPASRRCLT